jgi:hypothetical protein
MSDQQVKALDAGSDAAPDTSSKDIGNNGPESTRTFKADRPEKAERGKRTRISEIKTTEDSVKEAATPATTDATQKKWEGPGWTKRWKDEARKAAEALASNPELEPHWKALQAELDPVYSYIGQRDQMLHQYRQRFDPLNDMISPYEQNWRLQGMTVQQGLGQLLAYQDALARDPDSTLPQLAAMFKPRDAAKVIQALSQAWGADLGQVAQGAPYIDPQMQQMVMPLAQKLQQLEHQNWQREQQNLQQQQQFVLTQVDAFEQAVDEKGNKKHPFFREVFQDMLALAQMGRARNVEEAYELATRFHPTAMAWRAKEAEKQALANASRVNDASKQATDASRNVSGGKPNGRDRPVNTLHEAMRLADKQLGLTD